VTQETQHQSHRKLWGYITQPMGVVSLKKLICAGICNSLHISTHSRLRIPYLDDARLGYLCWRCRPTV